MRRCHVAGAIIVALGLARPLAAQPLAPSDTLLARLTVEALAANPGLAQLAARARAAAARIRPTGALADPTVSVGVMDLTLPSFAFRKSEFTEVDIELSQAFPWPGTLGAQARAAGAMARGARLGTSVLERDVILRIATLYYRLQYVRAARQTLARQQRLFQVAAEISTARYGTGAAPQSDPLQARIALARLSTDSAALAAEEAGLRAGLRALRSIRDTEELAVAPIDVDRVIAMDGDTASQVEGLERGDPLAAHPRLRTREAEIEAALETARAATLQGRPDFMISSRYGARPLGSDFFSAFAVVRVPIWAGRKQGLLAEAARTDVEAARRGLDDERVALTADLERTLALARASATRLRLLVQSVLPLTREGVEAALRGYRTGQSAFLSVLSAEDTNYRVELEAAEVAAQRLTQLVMLEQLLAPESAP